MRVQILFFVLVTALVSGCASVNSVSLTPIPVDRKAQVKTEKSKVIILGFNFDNDFIDDAVDDLKRQCPNGKVSGLLTKDETINYFLFFVWKKQITASGYCIANAAVSTNKNKPRKTASEPTSEEPQEAGL